MSTNGDGVAWLHVRIDERPKYYAYAPYRKFLEEGYDEAVNKETRSRKWSLQNVQAYMEQNVSSPVWDANEAYVPRFVWSDGLTMQHGLDPSDADFFVPGRVDAYRYEARHRSDAYPLRNTDYIPHESLFVNWFAFTCTLVMFCVANTLFLTRVGPRAKLDGRYVRFCLQLERERFYRRMIIAYSVCLVGFMVLGSWWLPPAAQRRDR